MAFETNDLNEARRRISEVGRNRQVRHQEVLALVDRMNEVHAETADKLAAAEATIEDQAREIRDLRAKHAAEIDGLKNRIAALEESEQAAASAMADFVDVAVGSVLSAREDLDGLLSKLSVSASGSAPRSAGMSAPAKADRSFPTLLNNLRNNLKESAAVQEQASEAPPSDAVPSLDLTLDPAPEAAPASSAPIDDDFLSDFGSPASGDQRAA